MTARDYERFWNKVDRRGANECWPWTGGRFDSGYGAFVVSGGTRHHAFTASRVAYFMATKIQPGELHVCHRCDNPRCVNPDHLWAGTIAENTRDRDRKHRGARGHRQGSAKLNEAQVVSIRKRLALGEAGYAIARAFGVDKKTIYLIRDRLSWCHV